MDMDDSLPCVSSRLERMNTNNPEQFHKPQKDA